MGGAWGDDATNRTKNSLSIISRGRLALDIYMAWCLFHCFEILPDTSSMKMIKGTVCTIRPFDFARSGFGESDPYLTEEALIYVNIESQIILMSNVPVRPQSSSPQFAAISVNDRMKIDVGIISWSSPIMNPAYHAFEHQRLCIERQRRRTSVRSTTRPNAYNTFSECSQVSVSSMEGSAAPKKNRCGMK